MAPSVEGAGVALNVVEHGAGAPVLLIHGLAADAEAMAAGGSRPWRARPA